MLKVKQKVVVKGGFGSEKPVRVRIDAISTKNDREIIEYTDWDGQDKWAYVSQIIDFNPDGEPVKPPTNFDVIESLNFVWACLNEFNPEDGFKNRFSEDTWDDICTAMSWIEDGCDVERKEGVLEFKTETTLTTEYFWDCECEKNYIHPKTEEMCGKCGYHHHEMPDSRTVEVIRMLSGDLSWVESKNKGVK